MMEDGTKAFGKIDEANRVLKSIENVLPRGICIRVESPRWWNILYFSL
jgi:hypothetical protein